MKWIKYMLFACLLVSTTVSADWLKAMQAYELEDYATASAEFERLLPLGNEAAAFNLGALLHQGEGEDADPARALAYFMLADELGHQQASGIVLQLQELLSAEEVTEARQHFQQLHSLVKVPSVNQYSQEQVTEYPEPIRRVTPHYPKEAASRGQFGYVKLRFLVDEAGRVQVVDAIDAFPLNVFERSAIRAVKRWRYQPSDRKHLMRVQMDFSISGAVRIASIDNVMQEHQLWPYAMAGSPTHQLVLGTLLQLAGIQSRNTLSIDESMPLAVEPYLPALETRNSVRANFSGFFGEATVRVDESGRITEQLSAQFAPQSEVTDLVGLQLSGRVDHDVYRIIRNPDFGSRAAVVSALFQVPSNMSALFWWEQAARNGNKDAQRIMAAYDEHWEAYLLAEQDAEVMAWKATRMILDGQTEDGSKLLEQANAGNNAIAKELKKQLL